MKTILTWHCSLRGRKSVRWLTAVKDNTLPLLNLRELTVIFVIVPSTGMYNANENRLFERKRLLTNIANKLM